MVSGVTKSSTDPQFGEALQKIQSSYGAGPPKPREIKKTLGKDDFLRIMITQMKHQDPSQPFKAEQFASELAQYASVEQLQNMNLALGKLSTQNQPMERLAMTNLIGKTVTVDRERFPHLEGKPDVLSFVLPENAAEAHISILSEMGETILQKDLGPLQSGSNNFTWDGINQSTLQSKSGNYIFKVDARGENGKALQLNPQSRSKVVGVSFEGTEPVFLVGDSVRPDKILMKNIVKIETDLELIPGAKPLVSIPKPLEASEGDGEDLEEAEATKPSAAPRQPSPATPHYFSFQKGVGSKNINLQSAPSEVQNAIMQYQQTQQPQQVHRVPQSLDSQEKGFPHGLTDSDELDAKGGE